MGHNMMVLTTEFVSKSNDGLSAFQCSICGVGIGSNTNSAKTCGDARSTECLKHSLMCEECFLSSQHNTQLALYLAAESSILVQAEAQRASGRVIPLQLLFNHLSMERAGIQGRPACCCR